MPATAPQRPASPAPWCVCPAGLGNAALGIRISLLGRAGGATKPNSDTDQSLPDPPSQIDASAAIAIQGQQQQGETNMSNDLFTINDDMMQHAHQTADEHLHRAIFTVQTRLGKGWPEKQPQIVAAVIQAAATDCAAQIIAGQIRYGLLAIAEQLIMIRDPKAFDSDTKNPNASPAEPATPSK